MRRETSSEICATTLLRGLQNFSLARAMPPKKAEEAAPPAEDDDPLAELATRALPPAFDDDALSALNLLAESEEKYEDDDGKLLPAPLAAAARAWRRPAELLSGLIEESGAEPYVVRVLKPAAAEGEGEGEAEAAPA